MHAAKYSKSVTCFIAIDTPSSHVDGTLSGPVIRTVTCHRFSDKSYPYTKVQGSEQLASVNEPASQTKICFRTLP